MSAYLEKAWAGELDELRSGTQERNNALFQVACRLFELAQAGGWTVEEAAERLEREGRDMGLDVRDIRHTLKSARKRTQGKVIDLPTERARRGLSVARQEPQGAPEPPPEVEVPGAAWQQAARAFCDWAEDLMWDERDERGLDYLGGRGLSCQTVQNAHLGYNPQPLNRSRARWGLPPDPEHGDNLLLPAGIVIPYMAGGDILKIEIAQIPHGKRTIAGSANALWGVDRLLAGRPVQLLEGVINALTVRQVAGGLVVAVALGASTHARRVRWIAALAAAPLVLVSTDAGVAGEQAADYWLQALPHNGRRWRPYVDDPNAMHQAGFDVRDWVVKGLGS